jgi:hypothetical protein
MRPIISATLVLLLITGASNARGQQASTIPESSLKELSNDLGDIQQTIMKAWQAQQSAGGNKGAGGAAEYLGLPSEVKVTASKAPVRAGADPQTKELASVDSGTSLKTLDKVGQFYAVTSPGDGNTGWNTGWISAADVVPNYSVQITGVPSATDLADQIFDTLTKKLSALKTKYEHNQYIKVTGFSVNLGVPPSASINFEFK